MEEELDTREELVIMDLPHGWRWTTLGDLCTKPQYGWTTKADKEKGKIKLLRTTDITAGEIDWSTVPFCTEVPNDLEKYLLAAGDIVISRAGSVGVSHLVSQVEPAVFASYLIRFRPKDVVDKKYLAYYLQSPVYWDAIGASKSGIALFNVNAKKLSLVPLPLAPLPQQRRIVEAIELQLGRLDAAVASLQAAKARLKRYKQAVLKAAFTGNLSGTNSDTGELPPGWQLATTDDLFQYVTSGSRGWAKYYSDDGALFLRITNMDFDTLFLDLSPEKIQRVALKDVREGTRTRVQNGDLLISITGFLGMIALVDGDIEEAYVNQHISLARPHDYFNKRYVGYFLMAEEGGRRQFNLAGKGATKAGLTLQDIKALRVPMAPRDEQDRIVDEIERRLTATDSAVVDIDTQLQQAVRLRQAVLKRGFEGRLV